MSHQTGIKSNETLRNFMAKAKEGKIRYLKIVINDREELELSSHKEVGSSDWKVDFNDILRIIEPKSPCYILYRLDERQDTGHTWLFVSWSPDFAPIKLKMLYAATKSTLKLEFGAGQIKDELFGTVKEDVSLDGYMKHIRAQEAPAPLTNREEELELLKQTENLTRISVESKHKTLQGVMFPIDDNGLRQLESFKQEKFNYLRFEIDIQGETIKLDKHKNLANADALRDEIPADKGRFHLFRLDHTFDGQHFKSIVFIYSMPGFSCSVKERMLYSSCKSELLNFLKNQAHLDVSKTFEISEPSELNEQTIVDELHPKKQTDGLKFEKPKGPASRGARRVTKPTADTE